MDWKEDLIDKLDALEVQDDEEKIERLRSILESPEDGIEPGAVVKVHANDKTVFSGYLGTVQSVDRDAYNAEVLLIDTKGEFTIVFPLHVIEPTGGYNFAE